MVKEIQKTKMLYEALIGEAARLGATVDEVLAALGTGQHPIVEVPWGERVRGEIVDHHQLVLTRLEDQRICFANSLPNAHDAAAGAELGGAEQGPPRRMEASGEQSMSEEQFRQLMAQPGAEALLPGS